MCARGRVRMHCVLLGRGSDIEVQTCILVHDLLYKIYYDYYYCYYCYYCYYY